MFSPEDKVTCVQHVCAMGSLGVSFSSTHILTVAINKFSQLTIAPQKICCLINACMTSSQTSLTYR